MIGGLGTGWSHAEQRWPGQGGQWGSEFILDMLSSRNSVQEAARWDGTYSRKSMFTHSHKYVYASIPGPWAHVIFHDKRDLADVMKLRILRRRDYPGRLNVIKRVLWREKQVVGCRGMGSVSQGRRYVDGSRGRSHWPQAGRSLQVEKSRNRFPPTISRKNAVLPPPWF